MDSIQPSFIPLGQSFSMRHSILTRRTFIAPLLAARSSGHANVRFQGLANHKHVTAVMNQMKRCKDSLKRMQARLMSDQALLGSRCGNETPALRQVMGSRRQSISEGVASMIAVDNSQTQRVRQSNMKLLDAGYIETRGDLDQLLVHAMKALRPGAFLVFKVPRIVKKNALQQELAMPLLRAGGRVDDRLGYSAQEMKSLVHRRGLEIVLTELRVPTEQDMHFLIVARKPA